MHGSIDGTDGGLREADGDTAHCGGRGRAIRGRGQALGADGVDDINSAAESAGAAVAPARIRGPSRGPGAVGGDRESVVDKARLRLEARNSHLQRSLADHAERVEKRRASEGAPLGRPSAAQRMEALRRRVVARGAGALPSVDGAGSRARGEEDEAASSPPVDLSGGSSQHRGEWEQLDHELPRDLRIPKTNEVSQMHSVFHFVRGDANSVGSSFAAGSRSSGDDATPRAAGGAGGGATVACGAGSLGVAVSTATTVAASCTAWHTVADAELPR